MSVVQGINTRLQMHTPLQIVRCCNLPLMPAVRVVRTQTGCVRFASPVHVPSASVEKDDGTGTRTFALFYAGWSDDRHTHRNTHTLSYILSTPLSASFFTVLLRSHTLAPILAPPTLTLKGSYSSSDSSSGDSYSSSSKVLKTNEAST